MINSSNLELRLKKTKNLKQTENILSGLRGFKVVATLVLVFKKIESEDKTKFDNFYSTQKQK